MKKFLLLSTVLLCYNSLLAQRFELGLNGGISNTAEANESLYTGDEGKWSYASSLNLHINFGEHFQGGIEAGMTSWERSTAWPLSAPNGESLGDKEVNIVLAKRVVTGALRLNYVLPFSHPYKNYVNSYFYAGISVGVLATGNDGDISYTSGSPNAPARYPYVTQFEYEPGYGTLLGAQIGYTYFFNSVIGLNVEFAPKMVWVNTPDSRYAGINDFYSLMYFPTTVGLRFRFGGY